MLSHPGPSAPVASCCPSGASWQLEQVCSRAARVVTWWQEQQIANQCSGEQAWHVASGDAVSSAVGEGNPSIPMDAGRKVCALPTPWRVRRNIMSRLSWCCHRSATVPKGIALLSPAQALGEGGLWGRVESPQLGSARWGPQPSPVSEQSSVSIWMWWLLSHAKAVERGPGAGGSANDADISLGFRFLQIFFQISIKRPICNSPSSQSIPVCSAGQEWPKHAVKPHWTAVPFLPQQRDAEDWVQAFHWSMFWVKMRKKQEQPRKNLISSFFSPVWPQMQPSLGEAGFRASCLRAVARAASAQSPPHTQGWPACSGFLLSY